MAAALPAAEIILPAEKAMQTSRSLPGDGQTPSVEVPIARAASPDPRAQPFPAGTAPAATLGIYQPPAIPR